MSLVLGIDGGGTKTEAALVDASGHVVTRRRTAGLDPLAGVGWEAVLADLARLGPADAVVLGLPCHGEIASVSARQIELAGQLFGARALVLNDVEVAFDGALGGADGVLILAGTGSMAWARGPLGTHRVGGWGDLFGDEGSAFWIGREALTRASQELDGRAPDQGFAAALLARIGIAAGEMMAWATAEGQRARIASLAAEVSVLAAQGQPEAQTLLTSAAAELARHGQTARRLSGAGQAWSFAGGVMAAPGVIPALTKVMGPPTAPLLPPVGGAVLRAARAAGWQTGGAFLTRLQDGLTKDNRPEEANDRVTQ